jgi:hypothetical protein
MKILSWDIGIKNLAYCIIDKDDNSDNFKILEWNIINLSTNVKTCQYITRNGKCNNKAKYIIVNKDKKKFLEDHEEFEFCVCENHTDKFTPEFSQVTKMCNKCKNKSIEGIKRTDYCWCEKHQEFCKNKLLKKIIKKNVPKQTCMKESLQKLTVLLYSILDTKPELLKVDEVLIENQPSFLNPTMKTMSAIVYSYFIMRSLVDKKSETIKEIRFIAPSKKLTVSDNTNKVLKKTEKSKVYRMTKKLGITYCKALISNNDKTYLETFKKKDDLCDCFLQGFRYLFSPVPKVYFDKIRDNLDVVEPKKRENKNKNKEI